MATATTKTVKDVRLRDNVVLIDMPLTTPPGVREASLVVSARAMQRGSFSIGHAFDLHVEDADGNTLASTRLSTTPSCDILPLWAFSPPTHAFRVKLRGTGGGLANAEVTVLWPIDKASVVSNAAEIGDAVGQLRPSIPSQTVGAAPQVPIMRAELAPLSAEDKQVCPVAPGQTNIVPIYRRGVRARSTAMPIDANNNIMRVAPF